MIEIDQTRAREGVVAFNTVRWRSVAGRGSRLNLLHMDRKYDGRIKGELWQLNE
jgi:hypothetical protein